MSFHGGRLLVLFLLLLVGLLASEVGVVHGRRRVDMAASSRGSSAEHHLPEETPRRTSGKHAVAGLRTEKGSRTSPSTSVAGAQMSKRRVRRGSDPIHNKC